MKTQYAKRWMALAVFSCGTLLAAGCGVRDIWQAMISGALSFVESAAQDSLAALSPIPGIFEEP